MTTSEWIFSVVIKHLRGHKDFAKVVSGAACEDWINAEAYIALNSTLRWGLRSPVRWVEQEKADRDLVIYRWNGPDATAIHVVELKVVYPGAKIGPHVKRLREQLDRPRGKSYGDETPSTRLTGIVTAVWGNKDGAAPATDGKAIARFLGRVEQFIRKNFGEVRDLNRTPLVEVTTVWPKCTTAWTRVAATAYRLDVPVRR